jgi:hypothetical protein
MPVLSGKRADIEPCVVPILLALLESTPYSFRPVFWIEKAGGLPQINADGDFMA